MNKKNTKVEKGEYGYLDYKKRQSAVLMILGFSIVAVLFFIWYFATKTKNNIMIVISILTVLPVAKFAVNFFFLLPYHSEKKEEYDKLKDMVKEMIVLTDLVFTTDQKFFPFPTSFMVIHNGSACGFTNHEKYHTEYMEKFLENNLQVNGVKVNVKIFKDKKQFFNRVKTLAEIVPDEKQSKKDIRIKELLLTLTI